MCRFFSFISNGEGQVKYFTFDDRQTIKNKTLNFNSHTSMASYFYGKPDSDDKVNKYELINGKFTIDQINVKDDSKKVKEWLNNFKTTDEFQELCIHEVNQDGYAIKYIKNSSKKIQKLAVNQDGYAIQFIDSPSEKIQKLAVNQSGCAIQFIKSSSEKIQKLAVKQTGRAIRYIKSPSERIQKLAIK